MKEFFPPTGAHPAADAGSRAGAARAVRDTPRTLNLGCGRNHAAGALNLDFNSDTNPDVVHDLNSLPWPLPANHFTEVLAYDVVEHLDDVMAAFGEIHRVCRRGAMVRVTVPHFSCPNAYTDPTHRHVFTYFTPDYIAGTHEDYSYYTGKKFRVLRRQLIFWPTFLNKLVWRLANRYPMGYEMRWAWMFPALFLSFELEVLKESAD